MKWLKSKELFYSLALVSSFVLFFLMVLHAFVSREQHEKPKKNYWSVKTSGSAKDSGL